ncbi:hypothetical protein AUJ14_01280 [Candidatus Micrarchaeota archaeon CG1_02_55_22]|nr:MAG: hypothetical protein AUJ14_01280 [Candidatus Micrarchaeota archaeon CG1_02_55_22]
MPRHAQSGKYKTAAVWALYTAYPKPLALLEIIAKTGASENNMTRFRKENLDGLEKEGLITRKQKFAENGRPGYIYGLTKDNIMRILGINAPSQGHRDRTSYHQLGQAIPHTWYTVERYAALKRGVKDLRLSDFFHSYREELAAVFDQEPTLRDSFLDGFVRVYGLIGAIARELFFVRIMAEQQAEPDLTLRALWLACKRAKQKNPEQYAKFASTYAETEAAVSR